MGNIITLTGPSGVGKGYLRKYLTERFGLCNIPCYTTRQLRGQSDSGERVHLSEKKFKDMHGDGQFLIINRLFDANYGFRKADLEEIARGESDYISEMFVGNVPLFRASYPDARMIGLISDSVSFLQHRLRMRGDSPRSISKRVQSAKDEISDMMDGTKYYDIIFNVNKSNESAIAGTVAGYLSGLLVKR